MSSTANVVAEILLGNEEARELPGGFVLMSHSEMDKWPEGEAAVRYESVRAEGSNHVRDPIGSAIGSLALCANR